MHKLVPNEYYLFFYLIQIFCFINRSLHKIIEPSELQEASMLFLKVKLHTMDEC
jgi:hypothetical protein